MSPPDPAIPKAGRSPGHDSSNTPAEPGRLERLAQNQDYPSASLYVIATPIGNLADITARGLECLRRVDAVAAEDTRSAKRLLTEYGISKPCFAAHRHNERAASEDIIGRLTQGQRIAYISDAGTPAISDPGAKIVAAVSAAGLRVIPIPGASAVVCALSVCGLTGGAFYFAGFLPSKQGQARTVALSLAPLQAQLVFYEAPHRVLQTVALLADVLGQTRRLVIARELTKMFEETVYLRLGEAHAWLLADANRQRGEFVLIVEGATVSADPLAQALPMLARLLQKLPLSEAVSLAAEFTGAPRNLLYTRALEMRAPTS